MRWAFSARRLQHSALSLFVDHQARISLATSPRIRASFQQTTQSTRWTSLKVKKGPCLQRAEQTPAMMRSWWGSLGEERKRLLTLALHKHHALKLADQQVLCVAHTFMAEPAVMTPLPNLEYTPLIQFMLQGMDCHRHQACCLPKRTIFFTLWCNMLRPWCLIS